MTKEETYQKYLENGGSPLPDPVTREELFLAYLCGMGCDQPKAIRRREFYLEYLGKHADDTNTEEKE